MKKIYTLLALAISVCGLGQLPECSSKIIYAIGNSYNGAGQSGLHKLMRTNTGLTHVGQVMTLPVGGGFGSGLAIADLGAGERLYTANNSGQVMEYDGANWNMVAATADGASLNNPGGNGPYLYFQRNSFDFTRRSIMRYQDGVLTTVWDDLNTYTTVADLGVDEAGNVYFFTGVNWTTTYMTDTLNVMAADGTMLHQYPVSFSGLGSYGVCFVENKLCVFFTSDNSNFPGKMVEFTLGATTATVTAQVSIPQPVVGTATNGPIYLFLHDVASCSAANPLAADDFETAQAIDVVVSPSALQINNSQVGHIQLYNLSGQLVLDRVVSASASISIEQLPSGLYVAKMVFGEKVLVKKFVK